MERYEACSWNARMGGCGSQILTSSMRKQKTRGGGWHAVWLGRRETKSPTGQPCLHACPCIRYSQGSATEWVGELGRPVHGNPRSGSFQKSLEPVTCGLWAPVD